MINSKKYISEHMEFDEAKSIGNIGEKLQQNMIPNILAAIGINRYKLVLDPIAQKNGVDAISDAPPLQFKTRTFNIWLQQKKHGYDIWFEFIKVNGKKERRDGWLRNPNIKFICYCFLNATKEKLMPLGYLIHKTPEFMAFIEEKAKQYLQSHSHLQCCPTEQYYSTEPYTIGLAVKIDDLPSANITIFNTETHVLIRKNPIGNWRKEFNLT